MIQTELDNHNRKIYRILHARKVEYSKTREGDPLYSEYLAALEAIASLLEIREELRKHVSQEEPVQVSLLDVPKRKGGY